MEPSQMFYRCLRRTLPPPSHSRDTVSSTHTIVRRHQQSFRIQAPRRTFTSTRGASQDEQPAALDADTGNRSRVLPRSPKAADSLRAAKPRQHYEPNDADRIDLSTLPGIPESYVPPKRSMEAQLAHAKLESLLSKRTPTRPQNPTVPDNNNNSSTSREQTDFGDVGDVLGGYDTFQKPSGAMQSRFSPANMRELLDNLDIMGATRNLPIDQPKMPLRLRPTLGRTQTISPHTGFDLARAFRTLEVRCNANNVKRDEISQRFHVRRGQKKKIDRRQRWRVLFKEGFLNECARIRRMKRQGW